ncbi:MAG: GAF domain-containing protein [Chloroflexi bacterium]|nr:GAF domain-containing protein [Chloroflexota bacterium]
MNPPTSAQSSTEAVVVEISELKPLLVTTEEGLHRQSELLKARGIGMPTLTHQSLSALMVSLDKFVQVLLDEQREVAQLRTLVTNSASLSGSFDLNHILSDAMDGIIQLTGAERGCIILVAEDGSLEFRVLRDGVTASNRDAVLDAQRAAEKFSRSIITAAMETGEALLTHNAHDDSRLVGMQSVAALDLRSVLCVPLRYRDTTLGVVYVDNRLRYGVFGEREKALLVAFANQVAVAMSNAKLYTSIEHTLSEITRVKELTDNVYNSIDSGVITIDGDDIVVRANRAAASVLGIPDAAALTGRSVLEILEPVAEQLVPAIGAVRSGSSRESFEIETQLGEKQKLALQVRISPLIGIGGGNQGMVIVVDDLTDQRDRAETLRMFKYYLPPEMVDNIEAIARLGFVGERREVSCMFADVRPLATLPKGLRPQQKMEMVNVYLSRATDCIHEAGGVIDKYMGTEIMALFNSQLNPRVNHAAAAVDAALRIRDHFAVIYKSLGIEQPLYRIGIHTGVATLGNVGSHTRRDFTAIGDSINLAKRLEENAYDGQIIVSGQTRDHMLANVLVPPLTANFIEREPLTVKGRQQQTRIYEVVQE